MASLSFDKVVVNPTADELQSLIADAVEFANRGARSRLVSEFGGSVIERYSDGEAEGWYEKDGGCVPNGYGYRAETSVLALAWFSTPDGARHVRVFGARYQAPKRPFGAGYVDVLATSKQMESGKISHPELVYDSLRVERVAKSRRRERSREELALLDACAVDVLDLAARSALADWYEENGKDALAAEERKAVALLATICKVNV